MESFTYPLFEEYEELDEFAKLPPEKIEEICYMLDAKSLGRFMRTSQRNKSVCQRVLGHWKRVLGHWKRCKKNRSNVFEEINIIDKGDTIEIGSEKKFLYGVKEFLDDDSMVGRSSKKNLESIESLYSELLDKGYIKIEGIDFWGDEYVIYYPKSFGERKTVSYGNVNQNLITAKNLGLDIPLKVSEVRLKYLIMRELIRRNKFISCMTEEQLSQLELQEEERQRGITGRSRFDERLGRSRFDERLRGQRRGIWVPLPPKRYFGYN